MEILTIIRKNHPVLVTPIKYKDLDKSKCSSKFLSHIELEDSSDALIYVKCDADGNIEYRGKNNEYRIIVADKH
jgi:hypothetical protein